MRNYHTKEARAPITPAMPRALESEEDGDRNRGPTKSPWTPTCTHQKYIQHQQDPRRRNTSASHATAQRSAAQRCCRFLRRLLVRVPAVNERRTP